MCQVPGKIIKFFTSGVFFSLTIVVTLFLVLVVFSSFSFFF